MHGHASRDAAPERPVGQRLSPVEDMGMIGLTKRGRAPNADFWRRRRGVGHRSQPIHRLMGLCAVAWNGRKDFGFALPPPSTQPLFHGLITLGSRMSKSFADVGARDAVASCSPLQDLTSSSTWQGRHLTIKMPSLTGSIPARPGRECAPRPLKWLPKSREWIARRPAVNYDKVIAELAPLRPE